MASRKLAAVACKLYPGVFSSERTFEVRLADGEPYHGVSPRHFCWTSEGHIVAEDEDTDDVPGKVAVKLLDDIDAQQVAVEVPDGAVLAVPRGAVSDRPTEIRPPVPKESPANVPV